MYDWFLNKNYFDKTFRNRQYKSLYTQLAISGIQKNRAEEL